MSKLTGGLIVAAMALGVLAVRTARRAIEDEPSGQPRATPASPPVAGTGRGIDDGMVIRRNEPLDDGIVVRSPFQGDPGIVSSPRRPDRG